VITRKILDAESVNFLMLADSLCESPQPMPLRRTFSLMRLLKCKTICHEFADWTRDQPCADSVCGSHAKSCQEYIDALPLCGLTFIKKTCHTLYFFRADFSNYEEIAPLPDDSLVGFTKVHQDVIEKNGKQIPLGYVVESYVDNPFGDQAYVMSTKKIEVEIAGRIFFLQGRYFAQQNCITNCCAHAAIKNALRDFYPDLTSESINSCLGINHAARPGGKGLTLDQIQTSIQRLTGNQTWALGSPGLSPWRFLKTIYHAIESGLPVISLFSIPPNYHSITRGKPLSQLSREELDAFEASFSGKKVDGHAVTFIGHSFTAHNWWSYAFGYYFFRLKEIEYLASLHWTDNFIIQDDNFGPYYFLSTKLLTETAGARELASILPGTFSDVPIFTRDFWLKQQSYAIVTFPAEMAFIKDCLDVEPWAIVTLNASVEFLKIEISQGRLPGPSGESFSHYFEKYFRDNSLILRTFILSKKDYIEDTGANHPEMISDFRDIFEKILPDYFWLTEISIPELFWINKRKIGEIITHPQYFSVKQSEGVILMKIPEYLMLSLDRVYAYPVKESSLHYPLSKARVPFT